MGKQPLHDSSIVCADDKRRATFHLIFHEYQPDLRNIDPQPMFCNLCARPINVSKTLATWALSALKARGRKNLRPKLKFRKCYQLSLIFFRTLNSKIMEFIGLNKLKSARDSKNWSFLAIS